MVTTRSLARRGATRPAMLVWGALLLVLTAGLIFALQADPEQVVAQLQDNGRFDRRQPRDGDDYRLYRDELDGEMRNLSDAIGRLDQSYWIPPQRAPNGAYRAGTHFIDPDDHVPSESLKMVTVASLPADERLRLQQVAIDLRRRFQRAVTPRLTPVGPQLLVHRGGTVAELMARLDQGDVAVLLAGSMEGNDFLLPAGGDAWRPITANDVQNSQFNLRNLDLLMLMACWTDAQGALPRAFVERGARVVVAPTAPVPDRVMSVFFERFLSRVVAGQVLGAAFDAAVQDLAADPRVPEPEKWVNQIQIYTHRDVNLEAPLTLVAQAARPRR